MINLIVNFKNIFAFILFQILHLFFGKIKNTGNNILFIHTAGLGDLIYTFKFISSLEQIKNFNFILIAKSKHKGLFNDYKGSFKFLFLDYDKYRLNIFYRIKTIRLLRNYQFQKVFQLNHNRRIIDDDIAINSGAGQIVALNPIDKKFPKLFKTVLDKYYDLIISDICEEIEVRTNSFLKSQFGIEKVAKDFMDIDEKGRLSSIRLKYTRVADNSHIIINPFSMSKIKDWEYEQIKEAINFLLMKYEFDIILLGNDKKELMNDLADSSSRIINLTDRTEILDSFLFVKHCKLFIGVDSALSHIARYYNIPRILRVGGGSYGIMFEKDSFTTDKHNEKLLFHSLDCFGCNWLCIYKEPFCLTKIDGTAVFSSIEKFLSQ